MDDRRTPLVPGRATGAPSRGAEVAVAHQQAIERYVGALNEAGMYVIIDMHWSSKGTARKPSASSPCPTSGRGRRSGARWRVPSRAIRRVILDLYNEPYPNRNTDSAASWKCDFDGSAGGTCKGFGFRAAGMQQLVGDVRGAGATNVVMVGGPQYAGDLDHWLQYEPVDPIGQLAASIHVYWNTPASPNWSPCYQSSCWSSVLAPLSTRVAIVVGEFGELDCGDSLYPAFLNFADQHGISYLGWAWFAGSCRGRAVVDHQLLGHAHGPGSRLPAASGFLGGLSPPVT